MSAVCTVDTNGVTFARSQITKKKTTRTVTPRLSTHRTEIDNTRTTTQAVQAAAPTLSPITQEDDHLTASVTADPVIRKNYE